MSKKSFFFSHDSNARNDDKLVAVRMKHQAGGYGIYFMLIERLLESTDYTSVKDYNVIAFDLRVSAEKVKSIIEDFGLFQFTECGKLFYSESLYKRMQPLEDVREKRRIAGEKGAKKRWEKQQKEPENGKSIAIAIDEGSKPIADSMQKNGIVKYSIVKKENNIKEIFEEFRKMYPGTKRGLDTEFTNYKKKHKDYDIEVSKLLPAIKKMIEWKAQKESLKQFVPEYANLQTWINQRRWESELEKIEKHEISKQEQPAVGAGLTFR